MRNCVATAESTRVTGAGCAGSAELADVPLDFSRAITFERSKGGVFRMSSEVIRELRPYVQDANLKPEAGGLLLGRHIRDSLDIVADALTTPLSGDRRTRFGFVRQGPRHQEFLDRAWRDSGGTCTYLGEWHTHPEPVPQPSSVDLANWRRKLGSDRFTDVLFFVIVGISEIRAWEGRQGASGLTALRKLRDE
jgi:integrative and conjugative element protein (TIGR02256 family)